MVDRLGMVDRGGFVSRGRVDNRLVHNRGRVVDGSRLVDGGRVVDRGMVDRLGMVDRGMMDRGRVVDRGMVDRGGVIDRGMVNSMVAMGSMHWSMSRGMSMSDILLLIVILMDFIGGSSRLGSYLGVVVSMSTVDGGRDSGGIAVFDTLVSVLVGSSQSQDGEDSDEGLHCCDVMLGLE